MDTYPSRRKISNGGWSARFPEPSEGLPSAPDPASLSCMSELLRRITADPAICHGKPVIRGLRYPVEAMLEYLAAGDTVEELLAEFPDLEREDLLACIEFANRALKAKSARLPLAA